MATAAPRRRLAGAVFFTLLISSVATRSGLAAGPAPAPAPAPVLPLATAPLAVAGPFGSTIRLELFDRVRGELVDWFDTPPGPTEQNRYDFLGDKLQVGLRWTLDSYEAFVQFQDSTLANVPDMGIGVGQTYYLNTASTT